MSWLFPAAVAERAHLLTWWDDSCLGHFCVLCCACGMVRGVQPAGATRPSCPLRLQVRDPARGGAKASGTCVRQARHGTRQHRTQRKRARKEALLSTCAGLCFHQPRATCLDWSCRQPDTVEVRRHGCPEHDRNRDLEHRLRVRSPIFRRPTQVAPQQAAQPAPQPWLRACRLPRSRRAVRTRTCCAPFPCSDC